jgi:hypothetical protein
MVCIGPGLPDVHGEIDDAIGGLSDNSQNVLRLSGSESLADIAIDGPDRLS